MKALDTDIAVLKAEFERVSSWDDWYGFVDAYFDWSTAPERSEDEIERDLQRAPVAVDGRTWEPIGGNYDVPPDLELLFGQFSAAVFARLEPEAHRDNLAHPERHGRKCVVCRVFTRQPAETCPFCGGALLRMPLNEA